MFGADEDSNTIPDAVFFAAVAFVSLIGALGVLACFARCYEWCLTSAAPPNNDTFLVVLIAVTHQTSRQTGVDGRQGTNLEYRTFVSLHASSRRALGPRTWDSPKAHKRARIQVLPLLTSGRGGGQGSL